MYLDWINSPYLLLFVSLLFAHSIIDHSDETMPEIPVTVENQLLEQNEVPDQEFGKEYRIESVTSGKSTYVFIFTRFNIFWIFP